MLPLPTPAPVRLREFVTDIREACQSAATDKHGHDKHDALAKFAASLRDLCDGFLVAE